MNFLPDTDRLDEVLRTLSHNKSRSLLTAFGVFWGVFMLVLLSGGGKGLEELMMSKFSNFTKSSGAIGAGGTTLPYKGHKAGRVWELTTEDVERIRCGVPGIKGVSGISTLYGAEAAHGSRKYSCSLRGVEPDFAAIEIPKIKYGRFINGNDMRLRRKVCVIGRRVYEELFPEGGDPCGTYIQAGGISLQIIGVDNRYTGGFGASVSTSLTMPGSLLNLIRNRGDKCDGICFATEDGVTVASVEKQIASAVKRAHAIHPDDIEAVEFFNVELLFRVFENLFRGINILVWMIGIGTLLSGAIGVSNIMLAAIRERTAEIGIRRAIGAGPKDILSQIICESFIITILAGLSGITLAALALAAAEPVIQEFAQSGTPFQVPFRIAVGAASVLTLLGVLAGIPPAMRAMAIKPVDAMREE